MSEHNRKEAYKKLQKLAPEIFKESVNYIKFLADDNFMPLTIEKLQHQNRISIMHYYKQNGALMRDPDMVVVINHDAKELSSRSIEMSATGYYVHNEDRSGNIHNQEVAASQDEFLNQWLDNILAQGYKKNIMHEQCQGHALQLHYNAKGHVDNVVCAFPSSVAAYLKQNNITLPDPPAPALDP